MAGPVRSAPGIYKGLCMFLHIMECHMSTGCPVVCPMLHAGHELCLQAMASASCMQRIHMTFVSDTSRMDTMQCVKTLPCTLVCSNLMA